MYVRVVELQQVVLKDILREIEMSSKKKKIEEVHPMTNKREQLINLYASDVADTAKATGHEPWELPWNVYIKNSKYKGKSHGLLNQFIASNLWRSVKQSFFPVPVDEVASIQLQNLRKGQRDIKKELATSEYFIQELERLAKMYKPEPVHRYVSVPSKEVDRAHIVNLSDWHIGSRLKKTEANIEWGPLQEARSVAQLAKTILSYKMDHRKTTRLILVGLGDFIENFLHGASEAEYLPIQLFRAQDLLRQLLVQLSFGEYQSIDFFWAVGNHDRDVIMHPKRAVRIRHAAMTMTIIMNLRTQFEFQGSNIHFHITERPHVEFELFGVRYYGGHGDNFLTAPNPGRALDTKSIYHQAMKINNAEVQYGRKPFKVFMVGHVHTPGVIFLDDGCRLVINGAIVPPDMYAQSVGIHSSVRGQMMFEAMPGFPIGDIRLISVEGSENDPSLDKIVKVCKTFDDK